MTERLQQLLSELSDAEALWCYTTDGVTEIRPRILHTGKAIKVATQAIDAKVGLMLLRSASVAEFKARYIKSVSEQIDLQYVARREEIHAAHVRDSEVVFEALRRIPGLDRRFDFDGATQVGKGYRVERIGKREPDLNAAPPRPPLSEGARSRMADLFAPPERTIPAPPDLPGRLGEDARLIHQLGKTGDIEALDAAVGVYGGTGRSIPEVEGERNSVLADYARKVLAAVQGRETESVRLADGQAEQGLVPGVAPVSAMDRAIAAVEAARAAKRGNQGLPSGGIFDPDGPAPKQDTLFAKGGRYSEISDDLAKVGADLAVKRKPTGADLRNAPRAKAVPGSSKGVAAIESVSNLARRLNDAMGLTHRQGRMGQTKALGWYRRKTGVIRTQAMQELDVLSHEGGHALEFQNHPELLKALKQFEAELVPLAYEGAPQGSLRQEGFAEFFRWYVTNPKHALRIAPDFYEAFETAMAADVPKMLGELQSVQKAYQDYLAAPSSVATRSQIVNVGKASALKDVAKLAKSKGFGRAADAVSNEIYRRMVDDLHPLKMAVDMLLDIEVRNKAKPGQPLPAKRELPAAKNPYAIARMSRGAYAAAHMDVLHGVRPYHGAEPEGPGLADALQKALGNDWSDASLTAFGNYLSSRRLVYEYQRYEDGLLARPPDKMSREAHEQTVLTDEAENPSWREAAEDVYAWNKNLWRKEFEAGLISESAYGAGLAEHPDYVPLMRDRSEMDEVSAKPISGNRKYAGGVKRFKGSDRDFINPIQSMMQRAYSLNMLIARNDVLRSLDDMARKAGRGGGAIVERVPAKEVERVNVDLKEAIEVAAREQGVSKRDVTALVAMMEGTFGDEAKGAIYRATEMREGREPIVFMWKGGEKVPLRLPDGQFGKAMFDALAGMNKDQKNLFVEVASVASRTLRAGVTTHPEFMIANYVRDQVSTWINSDVGFVPGVDGARGIADELTGNDISRLYNSMGGISGGANVATLDKARLTKDMRGLRRKGISIERVGDLREVGAAALRVSEISETGTRLGVFRRALAQAKSRGLSDYEAAFEAAFIARDVLDFDRRGSNMLSAIRTVTFLNTSIQGLDKMRRVTGAEGTIKKLIAPLFEPEKAQALNDTEKRQLAHAAKAWAKISGIGVLGLTLTALYANDPEYQEFSEYLRATHWMVKVGGKWLAVPKPFELAVVSLVLERGYEGVVKQDPKAWGRLARGLGQSFLPPTEVTALAVPLQVARNRNHAGSPIVPDHLRNSVAPEMQFNSYTSTFSKKLGGALKLSPAVIDHVITGFGGSWGRSVLQGLDLAVKGEIPALDAEDAFIARRFVRDPTRGSTSSKEFWGQLATNGGRLVREQGTFRALMNQGDEAKARARLNKLDTASRDYILANTFAEGQAKLAHPLIRAEAAANAISDLRRMIQGGPFTGGAQLDTPVHLTPEQKRDADGALAKLQLAEMRNGLIGAGFTGWKQKERMAIAPEIDALRAVDPVLVDTLDARMMLEDVPPEAAAADVWNGGLRDYVRQAYASPDMAAMLQSRKSKKDQAKAFMRSPPQVPQVAAGARAH